MSQRVRTLALDQSAAAALYQRHAAAIFAYLRGHTSSREDAEDVLLEVFLVALEQDTLVSMLEREQLAWLRRVAHHKLIDHYRRSRRRFAVGLEEVEDTLEDDAEQAPEQIILRREEARDVRDALSQLPKLQQEVLRLRFGAGLRCAQIAEVLGKREGAIRALLSRAIQRLRTLYEPGNEEDSDGTR